VGLEGRRAAVITVSDGVSAGEREDTSGLVLEELLVENGYAVERILVSDDFEPIAAAIEKAAEHSHLVVTTGGTGFGVRDVTPEATASVLDREASGLVHAMVAAGLKKTPMAALTRARAGTIGSALVINVPGSPKGALESVEAVIDLVPHALQLLSGDNRHH
jgi:molybdenum cofactor synthesis domain-containing protein